MLQETLVRAWKHLDTFEGRASLRAWLYKVATNACLDALDTRKRRGLSKELYARGDPSQPLPIPSTDVTWVEPFPDEMIDGQPDIYPEARYEIRESITLAFVAALQHLPGHQRAVLLLRDVMGWDANEAAQTFDMTVASVNSALQRARETMKKTEHKPLAIHLDEQLSSLLTRYVAAWEAANSAALVATLPRRCGADHAAHPGLVWRQSGHSNIFGWLSLQKLEPVRVRLEAVRANGCPAFAVYQMDSSANLSCCGTSHPQHRKRTNYRDQ